MLYISKGNSKGALRPGTPTKIEVMQQPRPLHKSISMFLLDRKTYTTDKLLDVVWKHAGFLCEKVVFNHAYETPEGQLSHTYDRLAKIATISLKSGDHSEDSTFA